MPKIYVCFLVIIAAFILNNMGSRGNVTQETIRPPKPQLEIVKPPKPINKLGI